MIQGLAVLMREAIAAGSSANSDDTVLSKVPEVSASQISVARRFHRMAAALVRAAQVGRTASVMHKSLGARPYIAGLTKCGGGGCGRGGAGA